MKSRPAALVAAIPPLYGARPEMLSELEPSRDAALSKFSGSL